MESLVPDFGIFLKKVERLKKLGFTVNSSLTASLTDSKLLHLGCFDLSSFNQNATTFEMYDHISSSCSATFLSSAHLVAQKGRENMLDPLTLT